MPEHENFQTFQNQKASEKVSVEGSLTCTNVVENNNEKYAGVKSNKNTTEKSKTNSTQGKKTTSKHSEHVHLSKEEAEACRLKHLEEERMDKEKKEKYEKFNIPQNTHLEKLFLNAPVITEIDTFTIQNRANEKVTKMIHPIVEQIEGDRQSRAQIEVNQDKILKRLAKLEQIWGSNPSMTRPEFAEELDSKIADLRALHMHDFQQIKGSIQENNIRCDKIAEKAKDLDQNFVFFKRAMEMREAQQKNLEEKMKKQEQTSISLRHEIMAMTDKFERLIEQNKDSIQRNLEAADHQHKEVMFEHTKTSDLLAKNILKLNRAMDDIETIKDTKLDKNFFSTGFVEVNKKIEKNRQGMIDNFAQQLATDNYLEKYLPFKIQFMVSEAIKHAVFDHDALHKYKIFEYDVYKGFHRIVMEDEGIPTLKKRAFEMPGYKRVMDDDAQEVYIQAANKQMLANKYSAAGGIIGSEDKNYSPEADTQLKLSHRLTSKSSVLLQDIVPIDSVESSQDSI